MHIPAVNYTRQCPVWNSFVQLVLALVAGELTVPILQVWINLGPLLYHFAESYCQEEVMSVSEISGSLVLY